MSRAASDVQLLTADRDINRQPDGIQTPTRQRVNSGSALRPSVTPSADRTSTPTRMSAAHKRTHSSGSRFGGGHRSPSSPGSTAFGSPGSRAPGSPAARKARMPVLVLDLDETLVHTIFSASGNGGMDSIRTILKRPGCDAFLSTMSQHFELVAFTAGIKEYGTRVLQLLDPAKAIFRRSFFRPSCKVLSCGDGFQVYAKDLRNVTKDLNRCIIIDNIAENYMLQPGHGLAIIDFLGDEQDRALADLTPLLVDFAASEADAATFLGAHAHKAAAALQVIPDAVGARQHLKSLAKSSPQSLPKAGPSFSTTTSSSAGGPAAALASGSGGSNSSPSSPASSVGSNSSRGGSVSSNSTRT